MKLQLKKVKYFAEKSKKTCCYTADLYMDGKKVAVVSNNGQGGITDVNYINGRCSQEAIALEEYSKTHPFVFNYKGEEYKFYGVHSIVDGLFGDWIEMSVRK